MNTDKIELDDTDLQKIEQIKQFVSVFTIRRDMYSTSTEKLFDFIRPNIIAGFEEIIQLPLDNITWLDIQIDVEDVMIISFYLKYNRIEANEFILNKFGYDDVEEDNNRLIKFGIPIELVFADKEDIINFILTVTDSIDNSPSFDTSSLTPEQLLQFQSFDNKQVH